MRFHGASSYVVCVPRGDIWDLKFILRGLAIFKLRIKLFMNNNYIDNYRLQV